MQVNINIRCIIMVQVRISFNGVFQKSRGIHMEMMNANATVSIPVTCKNTDICDKLGRAVAILDFLVYLTVFYSTSVVCKTTELPICIVVVLISNIIHCNNKQTFVLRYRQDTISKSIRSIASCIYIHIFV